MKYWHLERDGTKKDAISYEIVNVVQLTNLSINKFALRPKFRYRKLEISWGFKNLKKILLLFYLYLVFIILQ
jgi:hypothetical protein